ASSLRLVVGPSPGKRRQERMVDVDDPRWVGGEQGWPEDPHVSSEHHQLDLAGMQEVADLEFLLGLGVRRDRQVVERYATEFGQRSMIGMIADHSHDLGRDLAGPPAGKQIGETMHLA